jgi:hypothetical protein
MNFFDHKDLGNHLLQLCPKVVKHPVYVEAYQDILTRCVLSTVEDQFGDDDCLCQHDNAPFHKERSARE